MRWLAFLPNHREAIAAMDFYGSHHPVQRVYCFFVIAHDRRCIVHFNVTKHPTSLWAVQQLREAFPFSSAVSDLRPGQEVGVTTGPPKTTAICDLRSAHSESIFDVICQPGSQAATEILKFSCHRSPSGLNARMPG